MLMPISPSFATGIFSKIKYCSADSCARLNAADAPIRVRRHGLLDQIVEDGVVVETPPVRRHWPARYRRLTLRAVERGVGERCIDDGVFRYRVVGTDRKTRG